ncbi:MAG: hypothetical protein R2724_23150 [Bryobacterales bacterium]
MFRFSLLIPTRTFARHQALVPGQFLPPEYVLDHLYFGIADPEQRHYRRATLRRRAFDVLQDQLETLRVKDLLRRVLETLTWNFQRSRRSDPVARREHGAPRHESLKGHVSIARAVV